MALIAGILIVVAGAWFGLAVALHRLFTRRRDGDQVGTGAWFASAILAAVVSAIVIGGAGWALLAAMCSGMRF